MQIAAIDIGGTHARFTLAQVAQGTVVKLEDVVTLKTDDHPSLQHAWEEFGRQLGLPLPTAAGIAVACPVDGEILKLTNNRWLLQPATIGTDLGLEKFSLVNDFAAVAHAVANLDVADFQHICGPDQLLPATGTISIIGPGTGLGVAQVSRNSARNSGSYQVQATEGGHASFAPVDSFEDALLVRLRAQYQHVSVERVLSGSGLVEIYATLAATSNQTQQSYDAKTIWTLGLAGTNPLAVAAIARFCMTLGSVAGDIALTQGGSAVVLAGGLGLRLAGTLASSGFAQRFCNKGRFEAMLALIPVKLITHPQPGLYGAAAAFARQYT